MFIWKAQAGRARYGFYVLGESIEAAIVEAYRHMKEDFDSNIYLGQKIASMKLLGPVSSLKPVEKKQGAASDFDSATQAASSAK